MTLTLISSVLTGQQAYINVNVGCGSTPVFGHAQFDNIVLQSDVPVKLGVKLEPELHTFGHITCHGILPIREIGSIGEYALTAKTNDQYVYECSVDYWEVKNEHRLRNN